MRRFLLLLCCSLFLFQCSNSPDIPQHPIQFTRDNLWEQVPILAELLAKNYYERLYNAVFADSLKAQVSLAGFRPVSGCSTP